MKVKGQGIISEAGLNNLLDNMYALSRKRDEPFYNLVELAMNRQVILTAIHNIKSNKGSKTAGIDKKDIDIYLQMDFEKLFSLINKTLSNYNPMNLATICKGCHLVIHNKNLSVVDASVMKKINKYRNKLTKTNTSLEKSLK